MVNDVIEGSLWCLPMDLPILIVNLPNVIKNLYSFGTTDTKKNLYSFGTTDTKIAKKQKRKESEIKMLFIFFNQIWSKKDTLTSTWHVQEVSAVL